MNLRIAANLPGWHRSAGVSLFLGALACTSPVSSPPALDGTRGSSFERAAPQALLADAALVIRDRFASGSGPSADPAAVPLSGVEEADLKRLYEARAHSPLWVEGGGTPSPVARDVLTLLARAADDGLDPADHDPAGLERLADALRAAGPSLAQDVASFDMTLSASVLRYFRHLHLGRIDPRTLGLRLNTPADEHDFVNVLLTATASGRVAETAADLAPPLAQYRALRSALTRYRALSSDGSLGPLPAFRAAVHPGDPYAGVDRLHRHLVALGDLPPDASLDAAAYTGPLVEGVKRFQVRHGLDPDGVIGRATYAALGVPLVSRARQIELALERLRWLPDLGDERFLALNIPMFRLWVWDSIPPDGAPLFGMRAIVGRALRTETPVFVEEMRQVIFRPYWNVPSSILRGEILPIIGRDPDYLRRQNMEIVRGAGDDAPPVAATPENVELLRKGSLRLRQRPGPQNALGLVKFDFPNNENVYLHGTPAQELFSRTRRDFSHGCVRVEDPVALASWVLKDQPEWTKDRILAAMSGADSQPVQLARPIRVILFYTTAVVMPEDGAVHFSEDIYGHDRKLDQALARR